MRYTVVYTDLLGTLKQRLWRYQAGRPLTLSAHSARLQASLVSRPGGEYSVRDVDHSSVGPGDVVQVYTCNVAGLVLF